MYLRISNKCLDIVSILSQYYYTSMKIKFYPRYKNKELSPLIVSISHKGERIRRSVSIHIPVRYWNDQRQEVKKHPHAISFNLQIRNISNLLYDEFQSLYLKTGKDMGLLRPLVEKVLDNKIQKNDLISLINHFIEENKELGIYKEATIKNYKTSLEHYKKFSDLAYGEIKPDEIDQVFFIKFINFMGERGISNITTKKHLKNLKAILKWALDKDLHTNYKYAQECTKAMKNFVFEVNNKVYLKEKELLALEKVDLSNYPEKHKYRDLFLFQIYTSLRYTELELLDDAIVSESTIKIYSEKNKDFVVRPINNKIHKLLIKVKQDGVYRKTIKIYNEHIKEICKLAGVDSEIFEVKYYGKKKEVIKKSKFEKISNHNARNTFISLSLSKGMPKSLVKEITGHKSDEAFDAYNNLDQEDAFKSWNETWSSFWD